MTACRAWPPLCVGLLNLAAAATAATATAACAHDEFRMYGPFAVQSSGYGQLSTGVYSIHVRTAGKLEVSYTAPGSHCSSLRMHFLLDGAGKAVSGEVPPGHETGYLDLGPVTPGNHVVGLQAEGIVGGCNAGRVVSWDGSAKVWTELLPGDHSLLEPNELGELILEVGYVSYGASFVSRGTFIQSDGRIYHYDFDSRDAPWSPTPNPNGEYCEADLLEKFSHGRRLLGRVSAGDWDDIRRTAYHLGSDKSPGAPPRRTSTDLGITTYRVYRRRYANGDYEPQLIAETGGEVWSDSSDDGVKLRLWLDRTLKPGGYDAAPEPPHVYCVTYPCPQPPPNALAPRSPGAATQPQR